VPQVQHSVFETLKHSTSPYSLPLVLVCFPNSPLWADRIGQARHSTVGPQRVPDRVRAQVSPIPVSTELHFMHCRSSCTAAVHALPQFMHRRSSCTAAVHAPPQFMNCRSLCTAAVYAPPQFMHRRSLCTAAVHALPQFMHRRSSCTAALTLSMSVMAQVLRDPSRCNRGPIRPLSRCLTALSRARAWP
jgi:hypothetical protein